MAWKEALPLAKLQEEERHTMAIEGHKILFIWHDQNVYAMAAQCPHFKLPLAKGKITANNSIICPFHKSEFDLATGHIHCWSPWPPAIGTMLGKISKPKPLKIYPTRVDEGTIVVEI
ncbi:Rieske (2Fe-2S) protein [Legionella spiritensis]|uniref:Dioxygenase, ferredoxin subunit n=1 Tax=Legionella spiritensis TaxID=452 RepID=A0A0W0YX79_LEGSP|nr:Rieske (2Fe-2S) protein [Legionella spiritensis]KTD61187.1 dioxygenase, ferredoxin subunit [Legionella spiritensis]SNV28430.1 dioxygenase, ferredoxin subunit [Legionella spiritensis]VEG91676.1 dioxygenase, ferredoxin subunit [Legionella spiritensis]